MLFQVHFLQLIALHQLQICHIKHLYWYQQQPLHLKSSEAKQLEQILGKHMNGILLPKLFWPTVRKSCSGDWEKLLKFEAEGQDFAKLLRSIEKFIQAVKDQSSFWQQNAFLTCSRRFLISKKLEQLELEKNNGI